MFKARVDVTNWKLPLFLRGIYPEITEVIDSSVVGTLSMLPSRSFSATLSTQQPQFWAEFLAGGDATFAWTQIDQLNFLISTQVFFSLQGTLSRIVGRATEIESLFRRESSSP